MRLYRPVGLYELRLIAEANWRAFPPRLPEQPIFYPVLNRRYAEEIASRWNPTDPNSGYMGVVTAFEIDDDVVARYEPQVVGASHHEELWVPAEEQRLFERGMNGAISIEVAFVGSDVRNALPDYDGPSGEVEAPEVLEGLVAAVERGRLRGGPLTQATDGLPELFATSTYMLKWDGLRDRCAWTLLGPEGRLAETETPEQAMSKLPGGVVVWTRGVQAGVCVFWEVYLDAGRSDR